MIARSVGPTAKTAMASAAITTAIPRMTANTFSRAGNGSIVTPCFKSLGLNVSP